MTLYCIKCKGCQIKQVRSMMMIYCLGSISDVINQMRVKLYDKGPSQPPQPRHVTPGNHRHYVMILTKGSSTASL
jgi:hypothetical protein